MPAISYADLAAVEMEAKAEIAPGVAISFAFNPQKYSPAMLDKYGADWAHKVISRTLTRWDLTISRRELRIMELEIALEKEQSPEGKSLIETDIQKARETQSDHDFEEVTFPLEDEYLERIGTFVQQAILKAVRERLSPN